MLIEIDATQLNSIRNPVFRAYALRYEGIYAHFMEQISHSGLPIETPAEFADRQAATQAVIERLRHKPVVFRNNGKSLVVNRISPACEACRTGVGSATYFVSLECHRSCYYCFNPNQEGYQHYTQNQRDAAAELVQLSQDGFKVKHLALTGGEPLLHKPEALAFFRTAQERFPKAYTRLYTCGDFVEAAILQELQQAGLDEIRFSIRMHDLERGIRGVFQRIELATGYIPTVMVEMPVLPGTFESMQEVLRQLDQIGIFGINLLEFCFPLRNPEEFSRRGFKLKARPYQVLYNYWYAGGLPIAGSELTCLELLEFALEQGLNLGVHYCSLENKHTGQVFQQNKPQSLPNTASFSNKDYSIKAAKVFGEDILPAQRALQKSGYHDERLDEEHQFLEFHVSQVKALKKLDPEIGISYSVWEERNGEPVLRELKVDYTTARKFDLYRDI